MKNIKEKIINVAKTSKSYADFLKRVRKIDRSILCGYDEEIIDTKVRYLNNNYKWEFIDVSQWISE